MRTVISDENPFGASLYGFLWEKLSERPKGKHLDYGTFDGSILRQLIETNVIVEGTGVDLNKTAIMTAGNGNSNTFRLMSITKGSPLPFDNDCFDSVSMIEVIEHIYDQQTVLKEIYRVLKDNGILIVTVPKRHILSFLDAGNYKFIFPNIHRIIYQLFSSKMEYDRRYIQCEYGLFGDVEVEKMWHQHFSEDELNELLTECGFDVVEFDGAGLFYRLILPFAILFPFLRPITSSLLHLDAARFDRANLFCAAIKK